MPVKSKAQYKLMAAICYGSLPDGHKGISKEVACEFVRAAKNQNLKKLAEHVKNGRRNKAD